ncbi:hypothetical protein H696_00987 [Fonticula alba]|uniref:Arf3-interacting protein 1 N-terminal domain-containing protein n=1 Tax=Fonticula alba TaxID=691883 RepID=A0A058ZHP3_FONAL|nr:hypothetical protein H696_00987 [Fonticula alba]KCV73453.1 hypothetical protein H696_00987 [Fonticula alba]|eukprot:XP_009493154.1 hypothetical protein H696_00987 [Fonticula alba]
MSCLSIQPDPLFKPLISYVLLAEFDIDKGSVLSSQYPSETGVDVQLLAELMLPDGAHNREQDWTTFGLNLPHIVRAEQAREAAKTSSSGSDANGTTGKSLAEQASDRLTQAAERLAHAREVVLQFLKERDLLPPPPEPAPPAVGYVARIDCVVYQYTESSQDWEPLHNDRIPVRLSNTKIQIGPPIDIDSFPAIDIPAGSAIQFQQMEPLYDVIITDSAAYGMRFVSEGDEVAFLSALSAFSSGNPMPPPGLYADPHMNPPPPAPSSLYESLTIGGVITSLSPLTIDRAALPENVADEMAPSLADLGDAESALRSAEAAIAAEAASRAAVASSSGPSELDLDSSAPFLHAFNIVRTKQVPGARRGARTKALAVCTRHPFGHVWRPLLLLALEKFFDTNDTSVLKDVYDAVNAIDLEALGAPRLTPLHRRLLRAVSDATAIAAVLGFGAGRKPATSGENSGELASPAAPISAAATTYSMQADPTYFLTQVRFSGIDLPIRIPLTTMPDEVGDFSLIELIQKFGHSTVGKGENGIMAIFNALLRQQRILFVGYQRPASEVSNLALAACAMLAPTLRGFARRAFPYSNLTNLDGMLLVPGYIAGVSNPIFEDMEKRWDLLCNVNTGQVRYATHLLTAAQAGPSASASGSLDHAYGSMASGDGQPGGSLSAPISPAPVAGSADAVGGGAEPHVPLDNAFIKEVLLAVQSHQSEAQIRAKFDAYTSALISQAFDEGEFRDNSEAKRTLAANRRRLDAWKANSESYRFYVEDRETWAKTRPIRELNVERLIRKLRIRAVIPEAELVTTLESLVRSIDTDDKLLELLSYLPEYDGGLFPLGVSLYHPSESVRRATVQLFARIDQLHPASRLRESESPDLARQGPAGGAGGAGGAAPTSTGFIAGMNHFLWLAYERNRNLLL